MEVEDKENKSQNQDSVIASLMQLVKSLVSMIGEIFELAALEIKLAGHSVIRIIALSVILLFIFVTLWISLMAMIVYGTTMLGLTIMWGLIFVMAFNLLIALILFTLILRSKKNLSLPRTRNQLTLLGNTNELKPTNKEA